MIENILQTSLELSTADSIFYTAIITVILLAGIKLRSIVTIMLWIFLTISLIGVLQFGMDIMMFWFMLILNAVGIGISMMVYVFEGASV